MHLATIVLLIFIPVWQLARKWRNDFKPTKEVPVYNTGIYHLTSSNGLDLNPTVSLYWQNWIFRTRLDQRLRPTSSTFSQPHLHIYTTLQSGLLQLYGVTDNVMRRVQSLQNAAARLITGARRRDHITPVLCQLHWLPVRRRGEFKLACLVRQALCGQMPIYLADDIHLVSEGPPLITCAVPRMHDSFGDRSFGAVGPRIWNSLPRGLQTLDISYKHFKVLLKTYMFR